ncbi:MAG TPA: hypothetical protein PKJ55_13120 [Novosphingobium sp.]|nr:hypothetical protein [Novosphingobium sp.]HPZ47946.1 hypothetical protein [Novosphingobium sp.]HQE00324.1 hypothetical protein [Novosphingobium sp.]
MAGSAWAQTVPGGITYANNIDTSVVTDVTYTKDVALTGTVTLSGSVDVDSSAVAVNDVKQIQGPSVVYYREENELNGENGYVDPVFGPGWSESGNDPNDQLIDGAPESQIRAGYFAPIINTLNDVNVDGTGNLGLNTAAGYFNMQMNSASLAVSSDSNADAVGGWAEASSTALQSLTGVIHMAAPGDILNEDDPEAGGGGNNFRDRNSLTAWDIAGAGNVGVNGAAGAFNQQANLLTLAVADNSTLAEANAGLIQTAYGNVTEQQDSINTVDGLTVGGTGNIGVNLAAGVGNQQLNALTIASSTTTATPGETGGGGGGGGGDGS